MPAFTPPCFTEQRPDARASRCWRLRHAKRSRQVLPLRRKVSSYRKHSPCGVRGCRVPGIHWVLEHIPSGEGRLLHLHTDASSCPLILTLALHTCSLQGTRTPTWASTSRVRRDALTDYNEKGPHSCAADALHDAGRPRLLDPLGLVNGHTVPL